MADDKWRSIDELRVTDRDYSGMYYSMDYAYVHKNCRNFQASFGNKIKIIENIHVKKGDDGSILYRLEDRHCADMISRFNTQFGTYVSKDEGEFGGILIAPDGESISGNFKYVFDLGDKVYAISTMGHLTIAHTTIYCFQDASTASFIYSAGHGDLLTMMMFPDKIKTSESMLCNAVYLREEEAYVVISGSITQLSSNTSIDVMRLIRIKDGKADVLHEYSGKIPSDINSIIVENGKLYIGCDKMLEIISLENEDGEFPESVHLTYLTEEDETDLIKTGNEE